MKAVNVDDVLKILHKYGKYIFVTDEKRYSSMVDEIANLKALEQQKTAAWVPVDAEPHDIYECNACGWLLYYEDRTDFKYCPNCGARMVEPQESGDKE